MTDEARRLFTIVVKELWHKYPELVVPGWASEYGSWERTEGWAADIIPVELSSDADILAAAALCAEWIAEHAFGRHSIVKLLDPNAYAYRDGFRWFDSNRNKPVIYSRCWPSAQFAAVLAEHGIDYEAAETAQKKGTDDAVEN